MNWLEPEKKSENKETESMVSKFFTGTLMILAGVVVLMVAIELLISIAGWLVLGGVLAAGVWVLQRRAWARRNQW